MHAWLLAISLVVGEEAPLGPPSALVPAPNRQYEAVLAAAPHGFLAVWRDGRTETSDFGGEVYAARIAPNGEVLDPEGLRLMPKLHHNTPAVWNGTEWIVVADYERDIVMCRVPARGAPGPPVTIAKNESAGAIASNGDGVLLLTREQYVDGGSVGMRRLRATLFDAKGMRGKTIELSESVWIAYTNVIVRGRDYLLLFEEKDAYQLITIRPDGSVRRRPLFILQGVVKLAIADNGRDTLLVIERDKRLFAAPIDLAAPEPPRWIEIAELDGNSSTSAGHEVIWDGETFRVFWAAGPSLFRQRVYSMRVARDGTAASDPADVAGANASTWAPHAVAASGNMHALVWAGANVSLQEDIMVRTSASGDAPILVSRGATLQQTPALAANGDALLAAVRERDQSGVIVAGRAPLTATSLRVPAGLASAAAIASSNEESVVVWADSEALIGQRFDRAGKPLGERVAIERVCDDAHFSHSAPSTPSIASSGTSYLVAWLPCGSYYGVEVLHLDLKLDVYAQVRIEPAPRQVAMLVPPQPPQILSPRAAWSGSEYLVAWMEATVRVMRWKDRALEQVQSMPASVLDTAPIAFAARGSEAVVVWVEYRSKNQELCVVAGGKALQCVPYEKEMLSGPAIVATAGDFFVAWSTSRNGQLDVVGTFLSDPKPFPIAATSDDEQAPSLAVVDGEIVVGYQRRTAATNGVPRAFLRPLRPASASQTSR